MRTALSSSLLLRSSLRSSPQFFVQKRDCSQTSEKRASTCVQVFNFCRLRQRLARLNSGRMLRRKQPFLHDAQDKLHRCHEACHRNQNLGHVNTEQSEHKVIRLLNSVNEKVCTFLRA